MAAPNTSKEEKTQLGKPAFVICWNMLDIKSIQEMTGRTCGNNLVKINNARVGLNGGPQELPFRNSFANLLPPVAVPQGSCFFTMRG